MLQKNVTVSEIRGNFEQNKNFKFCIKIVAHIIGNTVKFESLSHSVPKIIVIETTAANTFPMGHANFNSFNHELFE